MRYGRDRRVTATALVALEREERRGLVPHRPLVKEIELDYRDADRASPSKPAAPACSALEALLLGARHLRQVLILFRTASLRLAHESERASTYAVRKMMTRLVFMLGGAVSSPVEDWSDARPAKDGQPYPMLFK